jgi:hypothetical protein
MRRSVVAILGLNGTATSPCGPQMLGRSGIAGVPATHISWAGTGFPPRFVRPMYRFGPELRILAPEKVHPRSLNLSSNYKISPNHKTRYRTSSTYKKKFTLGPSVVLNPVLSYVAAKSVWNPCGPHMSRCHVISLPPSLSLFCHFLLLTRAQQREGADAASDGRRRWGRGGRQRGRGRA